MSTNNPETWLRASDRQEALHTFNGTGRVPFEDGPFQGFMEHVVLRPELSIYRVEGRSLDDYRLASGQLAPEGTMILGCVLSGRGAVELEGRQSETWRDNGAQYVLDPTRNLVNYDVAANRPWQAVALRVDAERFAALADRAETGPLGEAVRGQTRRFNMHRPLGAKARAAAEAIANPVYHGAMQALYLEAKALELLAYQFDSFTPDEMEPRDLTASERLRVLAARELLRSSLRTPPALADLATFARMSERRLNQGFRMLFGMTAFEILRDGRLDAAQQMFRDNPDLPLKVVAWQVGYANASNFIKAYRRRFGVPPGAHRRLGP